MRNLLALLGAAVVTVVGVGWYLDWFKVHRGPANGGKQNYNVEFNTTKIGEDIHKGGEKLHKALEKKSTPMKETELVPPGPVFPTDLDIPMKNDGSPFSTTSKKNEKIPEPPSSVSPELLLPVIDSKQPR
jgi:hypothetical protein